MGKLNDKVVQASQPREKQYGISDGQGLTLIVKQNGTKLWWFRYRFAGKAKTLSIGEYPFVTLRQAREKAFHAKQLLNENIDPSTSKQAAKAALLQVKEQEKFDAATSFENVAREWFRKYSTSNDWAESHSCKVLGRLEKDIFPYMGHRQVGDIQPMELLNVVRRVESRGALETAHRALSECSRVFRYAVACGYAQRDPATDLRGALPPYRKDKHFAAVTDSKRLGELMRDIDGYSGTPIVRAAFALSPRLFLRPGELRRMEWSWIDFDSQLLSIPASAHKTGKRTMEPHLVPLCTQAMQILQEIKPLTGEGRYVFPSERDRNRPMSDNAVRSALRRMGWTGEEMTPHGFRATASTILDNKGYQQSWIERQLAHDEQNKVKVAYKRYLYRMYLPERTKMMQEWSDYLDELRDGAQVINFKNYLS